LPRSRKLLGVSAVLASLAALGVLTLLVLSNREGAGTLQASILLKQPPEVVWQWLTEGSRQQQWISWLQSSSGALAPGTQQLWQMKDPQSQGPAVEIPIECTEAQPYTLLRLRSAMPGAESSVLYRLQQAPSGTKLEATTQITYQGWMKVLEPLVTPSAQEKLDAGLQRLQALLNR
jgi:uncharacterized protein YndB with AHSA1/START domain